MATRLLLQRKRIVGGTTKYFERIRNHLLDNYTPLCGCIHIYYASTQSNSPEIVVPISKVLIANRGEIACRVMQTARKMGIQSVACYSDADRNAMHVSMADEAHYIGPSPATESYLRMDKIIAAAKRSGAQAIHPGYGFLSEKPEFANLCEEEGIIFIGPPSSAIKDMGIKSTSKHIMSSAGVPIIEGYHGDDQSDQKLFAEAERIGFPVMLKAVRGGGGKGMRIVMQPRDFQAALDSARSESLKAFGDDNMLVEKFVERPRHVEVQVFADKYGNTVYLFERDCSVQRRHQKIIEEAPAPGVSEEVRAELGNAAVRAAEAVGYVGAGTVEFIMDKHQNFYFMEMNTRLQVEHPVTEMITGIDLVELQIRAAAGEQLPFSQSDLRVNGHSFEARIYAEDPDSDFLPGTGHLYYLSTPSPSSDVRVETGVRQGDEVSQFYDPMIAKLVVWDKYRSTALRKLRQKLHDYHIVGLSTNIKFLGNLAAHPSFVSADVHTSFIDDHYKELFPKKQSLSEHQLAQSALALLLYDEQHQVEKKRKLDDHSPFGGGSSFQMNVDSHKKMLLSDGENDIVVTITYLKKRQYLIQVNKQEFLCHGRMLDDGYNNHVHVNIDGKNEKFSFVPSADSVHIFTKDDHFSVVKPQPKFILAELESKIPAGAVAPMTGSILEVRVEAGDEVKAGDVIAVMYAMKLEHNILSPYDGTVEEVFVKPGGMVNQNDEIAEIKKE
ncbi:methylcrotonoyl-CoA carboxylase subunit alpha, mitochondrial-like [Hydractinia symbiolongicarpus]|uniref:methylcrotonoyl-CoA carboxylase subunit alpha, mitochondrial-like n=1 Tax=Hydractinia symbiolongicarpus TaxID=13093 RepID=UPI00254FC718|nr:methylcrotonoyl-CoA carboxylase subunit alpha, mitochondrial-like [Hydractinia symbiolongicarpus]